MDPAGLLTTAQWSGGAERGGGISPWSKFSVILLIGIVNSRRPSSFTNYTKDTFI
jgi:hypothetical protein